MPMAVAIFVNIDIINIHYARAIIIVTSCTDSSERFINFIDFFSKPKTNLSHIIRIVDTKIGMFLTPCCRLVYNQFF